MSSDWRICIDFGTALSKAAAAPMGATGLTKSHPLAIGKTVGAANPLMVPCAVFLDSRIHFGPAALAQASAQLEQKREAMLSFKTVLAAADLESALRLRAPRAVDPTGQFDRRALVVIFLSWLSALIDEAVEREDGIDAKSLSVRYSRPGWNPRDIARSHHAVARMFDEARFIANEAGAALKSKEGLPLDQALALLEKASGASLESRVEGCLLEAVAAAACGAQGARGPSVTLVLDIGAGTTDIAALRIDAGGGVREIVAARKTLNMAGDALDRILLDLFVSRARNAKTLEQQSALWRRTLLTVREQKEGLFETGRAALRYDGKVVTVKRSELESDRDFKAFRDAIEESFAASLDAAALAAEEAGVGEVSIVLAGGGANLGFVQEIARKAKPKKSKVRAVVQPIVPDAAHDAVYQGQLAPIFTQLAIAMGGALAPPSLIAADMAAA